MDVASCSYETIAYYSSLPNICFLKYLMDKKDGGYKEKVVQRRE